MVSKRRLGLLFLLVTGCFQEFLPISAVETDGGVAFQLPAVVEGLSSQRKFELLDLMVTKRECSSDCALWSIVRAPGAGSVYLNAAPIAYGEPVSGGVVRIPPRSLLPARYAVSATVQEYSSRGELVRSLTMDSEFEIYQDGSGKPRVVRGARAGKTGGCQ